MGAYFVTICTRDRQCLFGEVVNKQMILNANGMGTACRAPTGMPFRVISPTRHCMNSSSCPIIFMGLY